MLRSKIRPVHICKPELCIGCLPDEEVAEPDIAAGTDNPLKLHTEAANQYGGYAKTVTNGQQSCATEQEVKVVLFVV